jgi:hypothetical protein
MIYEVRTYDLKPNTVAEVEKRFAEAYETRKKFSSLAAFWHTDVGPLNQIVHVWPYQDLAERARIREQATREGAGKWPAKTAEFMVRQRSEIFLQFPFSPELKPGRQGPIFEMRIYTYAAGEQANLAKSWELALPARLKYSPLTAVWYSELGGLNQFVHIWPYATPNERWEVRKKVVADGIWPPSVVAKRAGLPEAQLVLQENKILMPSAFSPLQ